MCSAARGNEARSALAWASSSALTGAAALLLHSTRVTAFKRLAVVRFFGFHAGVRTVVAIVMDIFFVIV